MQVRVHELHVAGEGPFLHDPEEDFRDAEEGESVPRRGSVEHHQVPARVAVLHLAPGVPGHLAEHDDLGERRRGVEEIAHPAPLEDQVVERLRAQDHDPVLAHRLGRADVHGVDVLDELLDPRPRRRPAEQLAHPLPRGHLANQHFLAAPAGGESERGGERALARSSLPGHDDEPPFEERRRHVEFIAGHGRARTVVSGFYGVNAP
jgi:hypothetical protein